MRRVISGCFLCKKIGAVREEQLMGDLAKERLISEEPSFTHLGWIILVLFMYVKVVEMESKSALWVLWQRR